MLRARATVHQRETSTYGYEVKGNLRAYERRQWLLDWSADVDHAWHERQEREWLQLTWWGRLALKTAESH
ncbi:hypothetical protein [Streptomyces niveus]|uniref:hypothetical protein n=1 Tax=Streptomyces niveus TaxID=193462 RepID=UPI003667DBFD